MQRVKVEDRETFPFVKIENPLKLLPILEQRLPISAFMYNSVKMQSRYPESGAVYTLHGEIDETTWIVCTHLREDQGQGYHVSADKTKSKLTKEEAVEIFSNCTLFDWDDAFFFAAIEPWLTDIVNEVSVRRKGNFTLIIPCHLFYMEKQDCLNNLNLESSTTDNESVEVKPLDLDVGLKFLMKHQSGNSNEKEAAEITWSRFISKNESAGVFVNDELVCGLVLRSFGILGSLVTEEGHKRKGYAALAMRYAFKELASNGLIPVTTVVPRNTPSIQLHEKLGCKNGGTVEYLEVWKSFVGLT